MAIIYNFMNKQGFLSDQIIRAIQSVTGVRAAGLHEPIFAGNEWLYGKECLDSTLVSSVGKITKSIKIAKILYYSIRKLVF